MINRLRILVVLMSLSLILLIAGIGRWVQSEYNRDLLELHREILDDFMDARSMVSDTILARNVLIPLLQDTAGFKISTVENNLITTRKDSITIIANSASVDTEFHFTPCDTCKHPNVETQFFENDSNETFLRGMKIFLTEIRGPGGENALVRDFITYADTLLLQQYFQSHLDSSHIQVNVDWTTDTLPQSFPPALFTYDAHLFELPYVAHISGQETFVIKQMTPLYIFAFLLIGVVVAAFTMAYRSIRKHMQLSALKDDLISNISHELKTPVSTVKVALEAMRGMDTETKKDTMQNYLRMAEQEVSRLDNLVNKIMQTVVGENNSFYQQHVLDLSGIVQSSVQEMQVLASERKATIETENLPYKVLIIGDAFHLQAAIHNLLDNAIKYGGDHPHISISIETSGNYYTLFIRDNGPGIPEAYQKKVFEKFFRIPTGNTHNIKGYGLGLHYVRQVIEACGGTISVHNNPVKGCTFTIQIPRADA